uniref:Uncharacterized protein n=1 Tax=Siphoviridae sp. ctLqe90 TaxID=2825456 RepID=A0A8S5Q3W4_9CAUD|nr:MAG TPA: hypothetical protein [Siphoviridae sp. ctLqe90]
MIYLDMYGMDEYQAEKAKILSKGEKPNRHNIVQFIAAITCLVKNLENIDFGEAVYKKPKCKNDWMILYTISKKFDVILEYCNELIVWQPSWFMSLISNSVVWRARTQEKLPQPFTYLNNDAFYKITLRKAENFRITWPTIVNISSVFEENEIYINKAFERALNGKNKNCNNHFKSLGFYITHHWNNLQFTFALLDYLTIRVALDNYEEKSCIWRTLKQHNIINNPENYNEIKQTMVTIHKLHLSINAVNSMLMFRYNFVTAERERERERFNYYNYWI